MERVLRVALACGVAWGAACSSEDGEAASQTDVGESAVTASDAADPTSSETTTEPGDTRGQQTGDGTTAADSGAEGDETGSDSGDDGDLEPLFRSAEGYLRMWERSERRAAELRAARDGTLR